MIRSTVKTNHTARHVWTVTAHWDICRRTIMSISNKVYDDKIYHAWEPELYTLVLGTLDEIPSTAVQVSEEMGVRGTE
eukprot:113246-Pyramimonas_sp.AAC.1